LAPSKFALSFTLGCVLIAAGFLQLRGWKQQAEHLLNRERLPFTAAYVGSVLATLYAALVAHSYLLSLLFSAGQVVALLFFLGSYVPGGPAGVRFLLGLAGQGAASAAGSVQRSLLR
jgi:hypothetical protein